MARSRGARRAPAAPARARSARRSGAVVASPTARSRASYRQRTPKKMVRLALVGALSDRAVGVKRPRRRRLGLDDARRPRTRSPRSTASGSAPPASATPRVLLVLDRTDEVAWKSFRNLGDRVQIVLPEELNAYDVLVNDWLVFTKATLDTTVARLGDADGRPTAADGAAADATTPSRRRPTTEERRVIDDPRDIILRPVVSEKSYASSTRTSTRSRSRPTPTRSRSSRRSRRSSA